MVSFPQGDRVERDAVVVGESDEFTDFGSEAGLPFNHISAVERHRGLGGVHELAMVERRREGWFGIGHRHVDRFSLTCGYRIMPFE